MENYKVYLEDKVTEITNPDLKKGKIVEDLVFVKHHEKEEQYDENGELIVSIDPFDEYKPIHIYKPYTQTELQAVKEQLYHDKTEQLIREKYTVSQELAILRQKDTKVTEYQAYNTYCEECKKKAKGVTVL